MIAKVGHIFLVDLSKIAKVRQKYGDLADICLGTSRRLEHGIDVAEYLLGLFDMAFSTVTQVNKGHTSEQKLVEAHE